MATLEIDRGALDDYYDDHTTGSPTRLFHQFGASARGNTPQTLLDGLDKATGNDPTMANFTNHLRANSTLADSFKQDMIRNGADTLNKLEDFLQTNPTTAQIATFANDTYVNVNAPAANDFENRFATALGFNVVERLRLRASTDEERSEIIREKIETLQPNEFLDAVATSTDSPEVKDLIDAVKANPELAASIHQAAFKDETVLPGFQAMLTGGGTIGGYSLTELTDAINDRGIKGNITRPLLTKTFQEIADSNATFDHLQTALDNAEKLSIHSYADFLEILKNPDEMIDMLFQGSDIPLELQQVLAGILSEFLPILANFVDPHGPVLGAYTEFGQEYYPIIRERGEEVLHAGDEGGSVVRESAYGAAMDVAAAETIAGADREEVVAGGADDDTLDVAAAPVVAASPISAIGRQESFAGGLTGTEVQVAAAHPGELGERLPAVMSTGPFGEAAAGVVMTQEQIHQEVGRDLAQNLNRAPMSLTA